MRPHGGRRVTVVLSGIMAAPDGLLTGHHGGEIVDWKAVWEMEGL